jgi:hypothetical protein
MAKIKTASRATSLVSRVAHFLLTLAVPYGHVSNDVSQALTFARLGDLAPGRARLWADSSILEVDM